MILLQKTNEQNNITDGLEQSISNDASEKPKYDYKNKLYRPIKITNIILLFIFWFIAIILAELNGVKNPSGISVFVTYFIAIYIVRRQFDKNPNFKNKVIITTGVWVAIFIIKNLVGAIISNLVI